MESWFTAAAAMALTNAMATANTTASRYQRPDRCGLIIQASPTGTSNRLAWLATWTTSESVAAEASNRPGR
jgi:hypothetical protein